MSLSTASGLSSRPRRAASLALTLALADNRKAWLMQPDGSYIRAAAQEGEEGLDMQETLLNEYRRK